jgi:hypothetical protein
MFFGFGTERLKVFIWVAVPGKRLHVFDCNVYSAVSGWLYDILLLDMGFFDFLFGSFDSSREQKKRVFISFAIEDAEYRDYLVKQAKSNKSPFEFVDMSVKKKWKEQEWQIKCRAKIKRCHGMIALISKNTNKASGARWEMRCAREEGVKLAGMHIKKNDRGAIPPELNGKRVMLWSWNNLENFINNL